MSMIEFVDREGELRKANPGSGVAAIIYGLRPKFIPPIPKTIREFDISI